MQITITVPTKADIVNGGFEVKVARNQRSWKKSQLGNYADKKGVYVHHSAGAILYVGKTTEGVGGTFGERLRREFKENESSRNSHLYKLLSSQRHTIRVYLLDLQDIDMMVAPGPIHLSPERKALLMEQALIGIHQPKGNKK
jgi:hypothetical protein